MLRQPLASILAILFILSPFQAFSSYWRILAPGIEYQDLIQSSVTPWSHIHVFRVDLKQNKLDMVLAKNLSLNSASVETLANKSRALIAINGGFFGENFKALGLRVGRSRQYNPLKYISWWGVFYIKNNKPYISNVHSYPTQKSIEFAVQSGPRLIVDHKILSLKPGFAERSALGITQDNKVIILVTQNFPISTTDLAHIMKNHPISCKDALNLDGGSSSQLFANIGVFQINVHGFSNVSDSIIVQAK